MPKTRRQTLGQRGEDLAADKLAAVGYAVVERNFRCTAGEIDIVARRDNLWAFVEVRARRTRKFGTPEESITGRKRTRLIASAQTYLQAHGLENVNWQIDMVAVEFDSRGKLQRVDVIQNAVNQQ